LTVTAARVSAIAQRRGLVVDEGAADPVEEVLACLRAHGIAFLPNWIGRVEPLRADFDSAFAREPGSAESLSGRGKNLSKRFGATGTGRHLKLDNDERLRSEYPLIWETFNQEFIRNVAVGYLGAPATVSRHIILTEDHGPAEHVTPYHFDELNSLKFLLYLEDIDEENAPLTVIPGTHEQGRRIREHEWLRVDDYDRIRSRIFEAFSEEFCYSVFGAFKALLLTRTVALTGPAGSVIVFDTDLLHQGGMLAEGRERKVMRGSCYRGFWP
jgi:ectoine hydroxylase-related dioxygenase (phytanoyl-CoA dioxygenase family)